MINFKSINYLLVLTIIMLFTVSKVEASLKAGDRNFASLNWSKAISNYERYDKRHPGNIEVMEKIAKCYQMKKDWVNAEVWLGKLYDSGVASPENMYLYGQSLRANMKYDAAKEVFEKYLLASGSKTASGLLNDEENLNELMFKNHFSVAQIAINSEASEFAPIVKDNVLYFISNRLDKPKANRVVDNWNTRNYTQIYMVGASGEPSEDSLRIIPNKGLNEKYHEGPVAFHPSTGEMYFTRKNYIDKKQRKSAEDVFNLKIFKTPFNVLDLESNSYITDAALFNNDEYSVGHVSFNEDGSIMYFASDMPGGFGAMDIWMAKMGYDGQYGTPVNLGPTINTEGNEMFPNYQEGLLYFASNGHRGLGGLDIYSSEFKNNTWGAPVNLGYPINTNYDDFSLVFQSEHKGFFTSNRIGGMGGDDIYAFVRLGLDLKLLVYDFDTKMPIKEANIESPKYGKFKTDKTGVIYFFGFNKDVEALKVSKKKYANLEREYPQDGEFFAKIPMARNDVVKLIVQVRDKLTNKPLGSSKVKLNEFEALSNIDGYTYWLISKDKTYLLRGEKNIDTDKRYLPQSKTFNTVGMKTPDTWNATILLDYYELGKEVVIDQIYYDLDKSFIRPDAAGELSRVIDLLIEYPGMEVEIGSHTDCRASKDYNQKLSNNRAKAAMEYLLRNGIEKSRLTYKGYGESQLTNNCACECDKSISSIGVKAFRKCEVEQVANCSEEDHQANRRTTFKIMKF